MKVQIPYLSRIEGHAHLVVDTVAGEVVECQLEVVETPRFFEKLLVGRHYSEVAGLASRICGVCSHSHTLVSLMATEKIEGPKRFADGKMRCLWPVSTFHREEI